MCGDPGISAFPDGDNIFSWKGTITGSQDTVFEGTVYKLSLAFNSDYPFKPPKVRFDTMCFHPNVDVYGNICLDILQVNLFVCTIVCISTVCFTLCLNVMCLTKRIWFQDKWSSAYDVRTVLLSIQSLLGGNNK